MLGCAGSFSFSHLVGFVPATLGVFGEAARTHGSGEDKQGMWEHGRVEPHQGCPKVLSSKGEQTLKPKASRVMGDLVPAQQGGGAMEKECWLPEAAKLGGGSGSKLRTGSVEKGRLIVEPLCQMCS